MGWSKTNAMVKRRETGGSGRDSVNRRTWLPVDTWSVTARCKDARSLDFVSNGNLLLIVCWDLENTMWVTLKLDSSPGCQPKALDKLETASQCHFQYSNGKTVPWTSCQSSLSLSSFMWPALPTAAISSSSPRRNSDGPAGCPGMLCSKLKFARAALLWPFLSPPTWFFSVTLISYPVSSS